MKFELLFSLSPVLILAIILYITPLLTRSGLFFSATVSCDFPTSKEGNRLLKSYHFRVVLWATAALVLTIFLHGVHSNWSGIIPMALLIVGVGFSYCRKFRAVRAREKW
jgi:hypothetical protein